MQFSCDMMQMHQSIQHCRLKQHRKIGTRIATVPMKTRPLAQNSKKLAA
jgi:hypothetical protein